MQAAGLFVFAGMLVTAGSAYVFWLIWPTLPDAWARYASVRQDFPYRSGSMSTSVFVFLMAGGLLLCLSIVSWFRALPRDSA